MNKKKLYRYIIIFLIYIGIWQLVAMLSDTWLIPGPIDTIKALFALIKSKGMYIALGNSIIGIMCGFAVAFIVSGIFCFLAYSSEALRMFFEPLMLLSRAVPVAAISILVIIWFGAGRLSRIVVMLVAVPILYSQLLTSVLNIDKKLLEMCRIYKIEGFDRFRYVYLSEIKFSVRSAVRLALGMSFKAGIAAELIGIASGSIGECLYMTKLYFETGELFAWIIIIMLATYIMELAVGFLYDVLINLLVKCRKASKAAKSEDRGYINITDYSLVFDTTAVLENINMHISENGIYLITGSSGRGKTTLLNCISGLIKGTGELNAGDCGYAFQETRLLKEYNATENMMIAGLGDSESCYNALQRLLDEDTINKPVKLLSGGEKKRVEVIRALYSNANVILLDEPFSGLDRENIKKCIAVIKEFAKDKVIVVAVHERENVSDLDIKMSLSL